MPSFNTTNNLQYLNTHDIDLGLIKACKNNNISEVKHYLEQNADVNYYNSEEQKTSWDYALEKGNMQIIDALLKKLLDDISKSLKYREDDVNKLIEKTFNKKEPLNDVEYKEMLSLEEERKKIFHETKNIKLSFETIDNDGNIPLNYVRMIGRWTTESGYWILTKINNAIDLGPSIAKLGL